MKVRFGTTKSTNPHIGSTFKSWLDEQGIREEATAAAIKAVNAEQPGVAMKEKHLTTARITELMQTSRTSVNRLFDPTSGGVTLETLPRRLELRLYAVLIYKHSTRTVNEAAPWAMAQNFLGSRDFPGPTRRKP